MADQVVGVVVAKKGCSNKKLTDGLEKLTGSAQRSTKESLEKIFASTTVEVAGSKASGGGGGGAAAEPEPTPAKAHGAAKAPPPPNKGSAAKGGGSGGGGEAAAVEGLALLRNKGKDKREADAWKARRTLAVVAFQTSTSCNKLLSWTTPPYVELDMIRMVLVRCGGRRPLRSTAQARRTPRGSRPTGRRAWPRTASTHSFRKR